MTKYFHNKIILIDDVLSSSECEELIEYYLKVGIYMIWNGTKPMDINLHNVFLQNKVTKISNTINQILEEKIEVDWCKIVQWPLGSNQNTHFDTTSVNTVFTSITYLNDNYRGGRTFIKDDIEVVPKIGRTVYFDGSFYPHGVTLIESGTRYTLPVWYKL